MRTDLFDFDLPAELIAQHPVTPRDAARLLAVTPHALADRQVRDLPGLLAPGDLLVLNDTRVIPARLSGRRGVAAVEITLHQTLTPPGGAACWRAFARPARRLRAGDAVSFGTDLTAEVLGKQDGGEVTLAFDCSEPVLLQRLEALGRMPLPPYIKRSADDPRDRLDYQTLFARHPGAVAAPTAALHFTPALMRALAARGVEHAFVTLHVGAGTFLPVKAADTGQHRMHGERFALGPEAAAALGRARAAGGRVIAVGTTVLRTLETLADEAGAIAPSTGETRLFITPGHRFRAVDRLLTNFHLPRSTLFMLVAAFAGLERMQAAYAHAIAERYRFYSYGDACLLDCSGRR
jgi:S-adenosylmethionine:tRNA ribosyltransferase-isomerase